MSGSKKKGSLPYPTKIEYQANKILEIEDIKNLNLILKNHQNESYQIGLNELRKPD